MPAVTTRGLPSVLALDDVAVDSPAARQLLDTARALCNCSDLDLLSEWTHLPDRKRALLARLRAGDLLARLAAGDEFLRAYEAPRGFAASLASTRARDFAELTEHVIMHLEFYVREPAECGPRPPLWSFGTAARDSTMLQRLRRSLVTSFERGPLLPVGLILLAAIAPTVAMLVLVASLFVAAVSLAGNWVLQRLYRVPRPLDVAHNAMVFLAHARETFGQLAVADAAELRTGPAVSTGLRAGGAPAKLSLK